MCRACHRASALSRDAITIRFWGTGKDFAARGWINFPTLFDDLVVHAGDLVVGDTDGVVVLPRARAAEVVALAIDREAREAAVIDRIRAGERTLDLYNF